MQNGFILSLAVSDLLFGTLFLFECTRQTHNAVLGTPFSIYAHLKRFWPFGEIACRIIFPLQVCRV